MDVARRPTQPSVLPTKRRSLRAASSANDLSASQDDAAVHAVLLPCCPPCPPEGTKKPFRLPRLPVVLREKSVTKKRDTTFRSCIDFTPRDSPANEVPTNQPAITCCPPYNTAISKAKAAEPPAASPPKETDPPRRLSGKTVKADPADLACFLAGCGPGECEKHRRRSSQSVSPKEKGSVGVSDKDIADDMAKLGMTTIHVKQLSTAANHVSHRPRSSEQGPKDPGKESETPDAANGLPPAARSQDMPPFSPDGGASDRKEPEVMNASPLMRSPTSSVFSLDVFPHVTQSQEVAAKAALEQSLSSTVVTNFSLPGPEPKIVHIASAVNVKQVRSPGRNRSFDASMPADLEPVLTRISDSSLPKSQESTLPKPPSDASVGRAPDIIRAKQSDASLNSKPYSPSLRSLASKAGSIRHALLKPSVTGEAVDTGLPISTILTQVAVGASENIATHGEEPDKPRKSIVALSILEDIVVDDAGNNHAVTSTLLGIGHDNTSVPAVVDHLTSLRKARILASRVNDRVSETNQWSRDERIRDESSETTVQHPKVPVEVPEPASNPTSNPDNGVQTAAEPILKSITSLKNLLDTADAVTECDGDISGAESGNPPCCPDPEMQPPQTAPAIDPANEAYWGFVPAAKEVVQDAVQVAVREVVQGLVVPPGSQQDQASEAYRKLLWESLAEGAKDAESFLREAAPLSNRERFEGDDSAAAEQEPLMGRDGPRGKPSDVRIPKQVDPEVSSSPKQPKLTARKPSQLRGPASPDDLKVVPLETANERLVENHKMGWKTSDAWNSLGNKRSSGYTAIPTRGSSKNRSLSPKNRTTTNSSVKESSKGPRSRKRSIERLRPKTNQDLRSESSLGSRQSLCLGGKDQADEKEPTPNGLTDAKTDQSSVHKSRSAQRLGRKNTIQWLRELLSSTGPYEPRFTALPPRTRRDENSPTGRIRSQTAPAGLVTEFHLGATPRPDSSNSVMPNTGLTGKTEEGIGIPNLENGDQQTAAMTQAFTKTINDLEFLLNEALLIARQAAERENSTFAPRLLGRAAAVLQRGRRGVGDESRKRENVSSMASMHESFGSFSSSDSECIEEEGKDKTGEPDLFSPPELGVRVPPIGIIVSTELTQTSHHDAGWPPTGRVPTPYPSGSAAASLMESVEKTSHRESPEAEVSGERVENMKNSIARARLATIVTTSIGPTGKLLENTDSGRWESIVRINDVNPFLNNKSESKRKESTSPVSPTKRSRSTTGHRSRQTASCFLDNTAVSRSVTKPSPGQLPMPPITPRGASLSKTAKRKITETDLDVINAKLPTESVLSKREVREYIRAFHHPPIQPRASSLNLGKQAEREQAQYNDATRAPTDQTFSWQNIDPNAIEPCSQDELPDPPQTGGLAKPNVSRKRVSTFSKSFDGSQPSEAIHFDTGFAHRQHGDGAGGAGGHEVIELRDSPSPNLPQVTQRGGKGGSHLFNLKGRNHISLRGEHHKGFSFARTHKKPKIARDWAPARKRFVATVSCISTALVGILVGIYAAEVPAIQYWIVDFHHYTILGNVFFFIGLSIPTLFFWPLPLLHGRKPYTLSSMSLAMPLLFPQALAVGQFRSPYVDYWRLGLIFPRALMGFVLGFANMNFKSTLTDLFGASLQSENPHQEVVDENDVRRHGGGLGVWLGIWTWCAMGSIGVGFLFGAIIINHANPAWGFYISIAIIAGVLLLNVICPEVRRSTFRRSVAELKHEEGVSRRLGRGEVKMHMVQTGPKWWGEEFHYGMKLNAKMLRQPGFMVLAVYVAWIYGQIVLLVVVSNKATYL